MPTLTPDKIQSASSETARNINRRIVLNLVRMRQPISRADLARVSGLQRSTVSLITEELIDDKWVIAGPTGRLPRGRRPTFLRLNERRSIIGIDIRPVTTTVAISNVNGQFLSQEVMPTPGDPKTAIENLTALLRRLVRGQPGTAFEGIGVSLPGRVNSTTDQLVFAPNLNWSAFDIKSPIERATGLDVQLENAANACVLAEVWFGDWVGARDLVGVTVSEGIGTGIYANGQLVRGTGGMAGEFGHVTLDPEGPACGCGRRGCWEVYASNRAAVRYYMQSSSRSDGLTFQDILALSEQGDVLASKALDTMARHLSRGLGMIVGGLAPEAIILVGELTKAWQRFGPIIEAAVSAQSICGRPPRIVPAKEGGLARLRGTVALILQKDFGIPLRLE